MEGKGNISDYRSKLDKTLSSPDLTNDQMLQTLVKNQALQSSHFRIEELAENHVVERRTNEVSNFLSMLRSASGNDVEGSKYGDEPHGGWKLKQDTEELRVMYREGPEGTPFHTLLAEGYVDGPIDVCLCISWEAGLYKKWWPQIAFPPFKVISSRCLQRVGTGEQISLVRMKVPWPLSTREALVHFFAFEYFQDDLMVVLMNSISESEDIDASTHGFTRDAIPDAEELVRIDVVGGFALQKVSADRSYFRTIANLDIKLDFVPPMLINFVSRQLIGSGFKLYKKEVGSVSRGDETFREALKDPLYARIRKALYSGNTTQYQDQENMKRSETLDDDSPVDSEAKDAMVGDTKVVNEIEELEEKDAKGSEPSDVPTDQKFRIDREEINGITENNGSRIRKKFVISPEVEQALGTLEKAISMLRENKCHPGKGQSYINSKDLSNLEKEGVVEESMSRMNGDCAESSSDEEQPSSPSNSNHIVLHKSQKTTENHLVSADANQIRKNRRPRFCCLHLI